MSNQTPPTNRPSIRPAGEFPPRLQRQRRQGDDKFYVDPSKIPEGVSYEWKRFASINQPDDAHQIDLAANHWRPVPADRHKELLPPGSTAATIDYGGLRLMERPAYLTEEAKQEYLQEAIRQVRAKEAQLAETPQGQLDRTRSSVKRTVEGGLPTD